MRTLLVWFRRLRGMLDRDRRDRDLQEELEAHLTMHIDDNQRAGMSLQEARRQALVKLGGVEQVKEEYRDRRSFPALEHVLADIRFGARMMRRSPGFTLVTVLSLAIGIGATAAIFSVVNAVVLRSLPLPRPSELKVVRVESRLPVTQRFSYPLFERLRQHVAEHGGLAAMSRVGRMRTRIDGRGEPEITSVQLVTGDFFGVLEVQPALGRVFTAGDNVRAGQHPIAVISHAFWQRRFAGAADIVGRSLTLNGTHMTIVGVAANGFSGVWLESPVDTWVPVAMQAEVRYSQNYSAADSEPDKPWLGQKGIRWLEIVLRAQRPDGPEVVALNAAFRQSLLEEADRVGDSPQRSQFLQQRLALESFAQGSSNLRQRFLAPLLALMAMVSLLLLIACANTANLLLARAAARQREMAVRLSIGASRGRMIQQLLTESLLLAAIAGTAGLAVAPWVSDLLVRVTMGVESGPTPFSAGIDARVLTFTVIVSVLTSLIFGVAPAWRSTDLEVATALKGTGSRGVHDGSRLTLAKVLVVSQVSLSLLLVVAAALFGQSFGNLMRINLGFEQHELVTVRLDTRNIPYTPKELPELSRRLLDGVQSVPGVRSAAFAMCGLMAGCRANVDGLHISGYQAQRDEQVMVQENRVGPSYFSTVGMRLVAGRGLNDIDTASTPRVAVVNEAMVRRYFRNRSALGERFGYDAPDTEIVGVVQDARVNASREPPVPMAFYPLAQGPVGPGVLEVRIAGNADAIVPTLHKTISAIAPGLPIESIGLVAVRASQGLGQERLVAGLSSILGGLALGLACLGLYGLMSYAVKRRTAELGVRMALGASQSRVLWMVLGECLVLVSAGLIAGVLMVVAASQLVSSLLFAVEADDPSTIAIAAVTLVVVGTLSGYLPAYRASRVDPMAALRTE
jgi:predicted permease